MDDGSHYGDYTGHGIDEVDDAGSVNFGDGVKHRFQNYEHNPQKNNNDRQAGKEKSALSAGEQNQQSDKDRYDGGDAGWVNRTGATTKMAAAAATGNVASMAKNIKKNGGLANTAKVVGPVGVILIILALCMSVFFGSQSAMLAGVVGNLQGAFDPVDVAAKIRSKILIMGIMSGTNTKGGVWSKFSDYMKTKFSQSGIEIRGEGDSDSMYYKNTAGEEVKVDAGNFDETYDSDTMFTAAASAGMESYGSSMSTAYGETAEVVYSKEWFDVRRNSLDDVKSTNDYETTKNNFDTNSQEELEKSTHKMKGEVEGGDTEEKTKENADGNKYTEEEFEGHRNSVEVDSDADVETKFKDMVEKEVGKGMDFSIVGQLANGACQLYNVATTINRMIKVYEAMQVVKMAMRVLEGIQRMQAGDGGIDTIVDVIGNYATTSTTKVFKFSKEGNEVEVTGSMMSSSPMAAVFGGSKLTSEDPIVKSFVTSESQFRQIMNVMDGGAGYKTCTGVKIAAGIIDAVGDAISLGGTTILGFITSVAFSASISLVIGAVIDVMVPKAVNAMTRDFSSFLMGPESSGVLMWGSEMVMGEMAKHVAMQPANPQTLLAHVRYKQELIADKARVDRYTLSPFDVSSEYTFLGSLVRSFGKLSFSTQSFVGRVGMLTSVVGKSLVSLTPASYASGVVEEIISEGNCPEVNDLNNDSKYASAFCTPKYIGDYSTIGMNAEGLMKKLASQGVFESYDAVTNSNPKVRSDNDNHIALCIEEYANRGAELGYPDAEIEAKYNIMNTGSGIADTALSATPVIGGIIDTVNNVNTMAHMSNILGYKYTEDTEENHLCERYMLDQEIGVAMGVYKESQVAVYMKEYREKHPLDNSTLGIIARRTGQTKEEARKVLAQMNALIFIANYEPEGLGPLFYEEPKVELTIESTENYINIISIVYNNSDICDKKNQTITA